MDASDLRAYGLIAQIITRRAFSIATQEPPFPQFPNARLPIYYHHSSSTFEKVASHLWRLGILRPLDQQGNWAFHFVFNCDVNEANKVAERNSSSGPSLDELFGTFIDLFEEYGREYHDFTTQLFTPFGRNGRLAPVLDALVSVGYIEKTQDGYMWGRGPHSDARAIRI